VLDYLQAEHARPGDSLATVLRNGRIRVTKKNLEYEYPLSKEFLFDFSMDHPEVYRRYKRSLVNIAAQRVRDEELAARREESITRDLKKRIVDLGTIRPGNRGAGEYHELVLGALDGIFAPTLYNPVKEQPLDQARKRVDVTFSNRADDGFFRRLAFVHGVKSPFVFFECKNYSEDVANPEFDQLTGRFGNDRGRFGVILCRNVVDRNAVLARCRDAVHAGRGYVIVLDDAELSQLMQLRVVGDFRGIELFMDRKFSELIL
jgi:hypothetical protein